MLLWFFNLFIDCLGGSESDSIGKNSESCKGGELYRLLWLMFADGAFLIVENEVMLGMIVNIFV